MATELNAHFASVGAPLVIKHFSSLWKPFWTEEHAFGDIFFYMLRDRGIHIYDGFPCFFTTSHGDAEVDFVIKAFKEALAEMQDAGFLPAPPATATSTSAFRCVAALRCRARAWDATRKGTQVGSSRTPRRRESS